MYTGAVERCFWISSIVNLLGSAHSDSSDVKIIDTSSIAGLVKCYGSIIAKMASTYS
jgi:hypothetical protein